MARRQAAAQAQHATSADHKLAFGSATERAARRAYWVDEMSNVRHERLWTLVDSIASLRAWVTQRLETLHNRIAELAHANERIQSLEQRLDAFEEQSKAVAKK